MEVQGPERFIDELIIFLQNRRFVEIDDIKAKTLPIQDEYDFDEK